MIFLDFEVFAYDWLVVMADTDSEEFITIVNDADKLVRFYEKHKDDIFVGYNIKNYDQWIFKGILAGFNPKQINDWIIVKHKAGFQFSASLRDFPLIIYDAMIKQESLKKLEGFMGINIKETDVDFNLDRRLTKEELELTEKYCRADVEALIEVFILQKKEFESHMSLIKTFDLPLSSLSKTKAQLSADILGCIPLTDVSDEWDIEFVDTLRIKKYAHIVEWFKAAAQKKDYSQKLKTTIAGTPHVFAWGGVHGAIPNYHGTGCILHVDVNSFYPAIMIAYGFLSRSVHEPSKYREIRDKRLEYKKTKNPLQAPYKIVLNSTYGICKAGKTYEDGSFMALSKAYDPKRANDVCVNGQLLLLDLIEHLEIINGFELIQSNTDGLIIRIPDTDEAFNQVDDICYEWEQRTHMGLGFDYIKEIWQKDVNNYVFVDDDGNLERKGAYVKPNNKLDNDLPIINTALVDYFTKKIPVEQTIRQCNDLTQFQKLFKITSAYICANHNGQDIAGKVFRVFASCNMNDTPLYKKKLKRNKGGDYIGLEKFGNCPDHCFILNDDISECGIPAKLDKQWYISLAKKRLQDYGCC